MATTTIELPESILRLAEEHAAQRGLSLSEFFAEAIQGVQRMGPETETYRSLDEFEPNAETLAAMEEARHGKLPRYPNAEAFMAALRARG